MEWNRGDFRITDAAEDVDVDFVETMLRTSYWAPDRPREVIEASIASSVNFVVHDGRGQVGFARVVTDGVTFAWIADVVVDPRHRRKGLGKWLMECVLEHPRVAPTTQKLLRTQDAHGLYRRFGFEIIESMARRDPAGPASMTTTGASDPR